MSKLRLFVLGATAALAGCATYTAKPLPQQPPLVRDWHRLATPAADPLFAGAHYDPRDGLDLTEVAMLAVANNPQLKVARDESAVAGAHLYAAGLPPDPQLSLSADVPTSHGPGLTTATGIGLDYDVSALLGLPLARRAARFEKRRTDLTLLWQEWQVVGAARILAVRIRLGEQRLDLARERRRLLAAYSRELAGLLNSGDISLPMVSAARQALAAARQQALELAQQVADSRHALNALLGLDPNVRLPMDGSLTLPPIPEPPRSRLTRRPDILALQAGYASEDASLRKAILAQFPALNLGVNQARDTSNVHTIGFGISLSLPLFNANRGEIAVARATRQSLYDDYKARLGAASGEIGALLADRARLEKRLAIARADLLPLRRTLAAAAAAETVGDLGQGDVLVLRLQLLDGHDLLLTLRQQDLEEHAALLMLAGGAAPSTNSHGGSHP